MAISKKRKLDYFEPHNSNFVDCEFCLESNSNDILALYGTNMEGSTDSGYIYVRGYPPLIW